MNASLGIQNPRGLANLRPSRAFGSHVDWRVAPFSPVGFRMRIRPLLIAVLFARVANADTPDTTTSVTGASVSGIVRDSIARAPLAGAVVQLVAADNPARFGRTASSDSLGRFAFNDVPDGKYTLGFFHPILDSLGVEAPLKGVSIDNHKSIQTDLAVPSPARIRTAICGKAPKGDSTALILGIVRDAATGAPMSGVTVRAEWVELAFRTDGIQRTVPRILATTGDNGWFAMCNVPGAGTVAVLASREADSTDLIDLQIPPERLVRRELFLGGHRTIVASQPASPTSSIAPRSRRVHMGDGTISGTVVASLGGLPLVNALVSITDGPETRTNEAGEWTILDAPVGTRMIEVRAVGYYPERRRVDIVKGAAPVRVALATLQSVLDTVKVSASRLRSRDRSGFIERVRTGPGRYMTSAQIAKKPATFASDLFGTIAGLRIGFASDTLATDMIIAVSPDDMSTTDRRILMRGIDGDWCAPVIYLDGLAMPGLGADDLDAWIRPKDIEGIEIYSEATVPTQFAKWRGGCGTVMIWKKR